MADASGNLEIPDATPTSSTDLTSLFGVNQNVGTTPVALRGGINPSTATPENVAGVIGGALPLQTTDTLTNVLQGFYGLEGPALTSIQQQLWAGGFYSSAYYGKTPKAPQFGTPDDDSYAAFKSAVVQAARSGKPLPDLLDTAAKANTASNALTSQSTRAPLVTQLPNPDDVRAVIVDSARKILGHKVDEATIQGIIAGYQQTVSQEQAGTYGAQPGGGTITQAPSAANYAEAQLRAANPQDAAAHRGLDVGNLILNAFMANPGAVPTGGTT